MYLLPLQVFELHNSAVEGKDKACANPGPDWISYASLQLHVWIQFTHAPPRARQVGGKVPQSRRPTERSPTGRKMSAPPVWCLADRLKNPKVAARTPNRS
mmetsp:Transcript_2921/g.7615  ORF Transcript_2921/g.7615 Transcript_2921/m.7615 type:complete len:100 (-) Transcript_2921:117-416(-)|eukprot:866444-Pelagomonas_calceolata.AAC.2